MLGWAARGIGGRTRERARGGKKLLSCLRCGLREIGELSSVSGNRFCLGTHTGDQVAAAIEVTPKPWMRRLQSQLQEAKLAD